MSFLSRIWGWLTGSGDMGGGEIPPDDDFPDDNDEPDEPDDDGYDNQHDYRGRIVKDPGDYDYRAYFADIDSAREYGLDIACDWVVVPMEDGGFEVYVDNESDKTGLGSTHPLVQESLPRYYRDDDSDTMDDYSDDNDEPF